MFRDAFPGFRYASPWAIFVFPSGKIDGGSLGSLAGETSFVRLLCAAAEIEALEISDC
jgi:hypothetical protein